MEFIKKYKYWFGAVAGIVLIIVLLIAFGLVSIRFESQAAFFAILVLVIAAAYGLLRAIQRYY